GDHLLNFGEREAEVVKLADPPNARERGLIVEPVTPLRARVRPQEPYLFVVVDRSNRLPGGLRDIADLEQALFRPLVLLSRRGSRHPRDRHTSVRPVRARSNRRERKMPNRVSALLAHRIAQLAELKPLRTR